MKDFLIWWLSEEDYDGLTDEVRERLPPYIRSEVRSREKKLVVEGSGCPKTSTFMRSSGGIVIQMLEGLIGTVLEELFFMQKTLASFRGFQDLSRT